MYKLQFLVPDLCEFDVRVNKKQQYKMRTK